MESFMNSNNVENNSSWAGALPVAQGLYNPENEKDSCGVGFIANIKGEHSHRILKDASNILCNMVRSLPTPKSLFSFALFWFHSQPLHTAAAHSLSDPLPHSTHAYPRFFFFSFDLYA